MKRIVENVGESLEFSDASTTAGCVDTLYANSAHIL